MKRMLKTMKLDFTLQLRNKFYVVGIVIALLLGLGIAQFLSPQAVPTALPLLFMVAVGGSTMLYIAGLVIFEKDEHTLDAVSITPLRLSEYIGSKVITLALLATLESVIVIAITTRFEGFQMVPMLAGIIALGVILALLGLILVVRYDSITDFLVPVLIVGFVISFPSLHFTGILSSPLWLAVPVTAPTMLMWGAFFPLEGWEWMAAIVGTLLWLGLMWVWAQRAFYTHIILKGRG